MGIFSDGEAWRRRGSWLINWENMGKNPGSIANPMEWFGFMREGGALNFSGIGLWGDNRGKWLVPAHGGADATYGTWEESRAARKALGAGKSGLRRFGGAALRKAPVIGAAIELGVMGRNPLRVAGEAMAFRFIWPALSNPYVLAGAAVAGIAIGIGATYINYRNKLVDFRREARQTEFTGDMTAFQTHAAATMRQRSMQAISRSHMNARRALGNEAQYYHMPKSMSLPSNPAIYGI